MHELRLLSCLLLLVVTLTPASAAAQTWTTLINDEFILPEGAGLLGHVPETNLPGGTWSLGGSPSLVSHNQAIHPTGNGAFDAFATTDARVSDGDIGTGSRFLRETTRNSRAA